MGQARSHVFAPLGDLGRAEAVTTRLTDAISMGLLADGEQLPSEAELAGQFGVATVTVREALVALRQLGLVATRRGRGGGSFVIAPEEGAPTSWRQRLRAVSLSELRDIGDHYLAVAGAAARLAAERSSPEDVERLRLATEDLRRASDGQARGADGEASVAEGLAARGGGEGLAARGGGEGLGSVAGGEAGGEGGARRGLERGVFGGGGGATRERAADGEAGGVAERGWSRWGEQAAARAERQFHLEVAAAAQSARLTHEEVQLQGERGGLLWLPPSPNAYAEHRAITEAIALQDGELARKLTEEHILEAVDRLVDMHLALLES
ncbi:FadR/GntR family transcriptional regulator [Kutzneria chonburiensis]|uniref:FadR/GntR family transcriptional regulator n=2 Tax=Kutzneria chonburiensis TaxID=1483604 RepID=A0ABV6N4V0_9PSEU